MIFNVLTYNRNNIAEQSINDLCSKINIGDTIHIIDDCSKFSLQDALLKKQNSINTIYTINKENLGVENNNIQRLNNNIYNICDFVYLSDNDVEYSSLFHDKLINLKQLMETNDNIFASSLFNFDAGSHFVKSTYNENYVIKNSIGGVSMLIRVKDFKVAMLHYMSNEYRGVKGWDWSVCEYARLHKKILIATKNSYIQHIGIEGVNSTKNNYDFANNFVN